MTRKTPALFPVPYLSLFFAFYLGVLGQKGIGLTVKFHSCSNLNVRICLSSHVLSSYVFRRIFTANLGGVQLQPISRSRDRSRSRNLRIPLIRLSNLNFFSSYPISTRLGAAVCCDRQDGCRADVDKAQRREPPYLGMDH